jgi:hypothetical protein
MPMRVRADTLFDEIEEVEKILQHWKGRLNEGVPGDDIPAGDSMAEEIFHYQLRGELHLCAARLAALVEVLEG